MILTWLIVNEAKKTLFIFAVCIQLPTHTFTECATTLKKSYGMITSPRFPNNYDNFVDCTWLIQLPLGQLVELNFIEFDIVKYSYASGCENS